MDYDTAPVLDVMRDALQRVYDACADETLVNGPGNGKGKRYAIGVAAAVALALGRAKEAPAQMAKTNKVKFPSQTMGDGTQAGTLSVFARAWNGCLQTIRELNPDLKFEEACLDESRKFHLDLGLADRMQARADTAEAEAVKVRERLSSLQEHCRQLVNVLMWLNQRGGLGLDVHERITAVLTREHTVPTAPEPASDTDRQQLAIAKLLLGQVDNRMFLVGRFEIRRRDGGWILVLPGTGTLVDGPGKFKEFADPVQASLRAKELADVKGGAA
ncbi:MAG: hypothetical protein C0483_18435 [Pirellula sp.]|nr:hypothetical protein [Pirellula sp.]